MSIVFHPSRLTTARLIRRMSRPELAEAVGCSPSYIAHYEAGSRDATPVASLLANALEYPAEYFFGREVEMPVRGSLAWRRKSSLKVVEQERARALAASAIADIAPVVRQQVCVPDVAVPDLSVHTGNDPFFVGELGAEELRRMYGMGNAPLRHAIDLAESLGVLVFWMDGPEELHGVSFWVGSQPGILLNGNAKDGYRVRFTVLHELGHLIFHRNIEIPGKPEDREADAFASGMLMPVATFQRAVPRYFDPYGMLDDRAIWGTSVAAMARRAKDLRIYGDYEYRDACIRIASLGWRMGEPRPMEPEVSTLHRYFLGEAGERGVSSFDLAERAKLRYHDFVSAVPQARHYENSLKLADLFS